MEEIMVSVYCLAYNHEKYICSALDGFVNQITDFKYEVIVHDDASTDNTAVIIREYEKKYPNIIKPIYQKENQWSKNINVFSKHIYPRIRGKYIAVCEGDDYWVDPYKLQKQVDYLNANPDCTFCFTNGIIKDMQNKSEDKRFIPYGEDRIYFENKNKEYTLENMYEMSFIPTASIMYPAKNIRMFPESFNGTCPTGDLRVRLFSTAVGYAYYINDVTCVYRQNVPDSAMTKWKTQAKSEEYVRQKKIIAMIDDVNVFSDGRYKEALFKIKVKHIQALISNSKNFKFLKNAEYERVFNELSFGKRIKCVCRIIIPQWFLNIVRKCKSYVGN